MKSADIHNSDVVRNLHSGERSRVRVPLDPFAFCCVALVVAAAMFLCGSRATAQSAPSSPKAGESQPGNAENGKKLFVKYGCYECHGREAQGGGLNGPRLAPNPDPLPVILAYVRHPMGEMPPFTEKVVSDKDLADIYAFLKSRPQPPPVDSIPILKH